MEKLKLKKSIIKKLVIASVFVSTTSIAVTDKEGFYLGGNIGSANLDTGGFDKSKFGAGIYGGYSFSETWGIESTIFASSNLADEGTITASALTLAPTLRYNFSNDASVFVKAGVARGVASVKFNGSDRDFSGTGFIWGLGADYSMTDNLNLRLSYETVSADLEYNRISETKSDADISFLSVGIHYKF